MHAPIARHDLAVAIPLEAGHRVLAAALQLAAQHILGLVTSGRHGRSDGCGCVTRPGCAVECRSSPPMRSVAFQKDAILHEKQELERRVIDSLFDGMHVQGPQHRRREHSHSAQARWRTWMTGTRQRVTRADADNMFQTAQMSTSMRAKLACSCRCQRGMTRRLFDQRRCSAPVTIDIA